MLQMTPEQTKRAHILLMQLGFIPALNPHLREGMIDMPSSYLNDAWRLFLEITPPDDLPSWARERDLADWPTALPMAMSLPTRTPDLEMIKRYNRGEDHAIALEKAAQLDASSGS